MELVVSIRCHPFNNMTERNGMLFVELCGSSQEHFFRDSVAVGVAAIVLESEYYLVGTVLRFHHNDRIRKNPPHAMNESTVLSGIF